jgi:hypothetical protein
LTVQLSPSNARSRTTYAQPPPVSLADCFNMSGQRTMALAAACLLMMALALIPVNADAPTAQGAAPEQDVQVDPALFGRCHWPWRWDTGYNNGEWAYCHWNSCKHRYCLCCRGRWTNCGYDPTTATCDGNNPGHRKLLTTTISTMNAANPTDV